jgi:class 3 adenylate cyclase
MTALLASSPTCYVSSLAEYSADGRWILARSPGAFLLTDIEGSSLLWQRSPGSMAAALARHDLLITKLVTDSAGRIIKHTGDGFFAFFDGGNPLGCALEIQKAMASEDWGDLGALPVRIAVHAGSAERRGDDLFGIDVNFTSRLLSAAWGGQILASAEAAGSLPLPADASFLDLGVHMLRSFETPRPLLQLCHPGLPRNDFPPPNTQGGRSSNLPHPGSPLVGREGELEKLCLMLSDPSTRLVSIVGPGGMGKTRLAQQVALEILPEFAQGACYVPLAPLDTPELISAAIAESLGMRFHGPEDPLTLLTRYLRDREVLIVLDNFEHLIGGSATVGTILSSAPLPKILVTSRERLNLPGEYVFELSGLEYPAGGLPADTTELGAVRLFLDRAAALLPGYRPSGEDLEAVAMLTAVLRGMPLAIELAAGWVRMLSPSEILEETGKSLDFLESSSRGITGASGPSSPIAGPC